MTIQANDFLELFLKIYIQFDKLSLLTHFFKLIFNDNFFNDNLLYQQLTIYLRYLDLQLDRQNLLCNENKSLIFKTSKSIVNVIACVFLIHKCVNFYMNRRKWMTFRRPWRDRGRRSRSGETQSPHYRQTLMTSARKLVSHQSDPVCSLGRSGHIFLFKRMQLQKDTIYYTTL